MVNVVVVPPVPGAVTPFCSTPPLWFNKVPMAPPMEFPPFAWAKSTKPPVTFTAAVLVRPNRLNPG